MRPGTLREALRLRSEEGSDLPFNEFLDEFYLSDDSVVRLARLSDEPGLTGSVRTDAFVGATAEHLCRRWGLGMPPAWTEAPERFLEEPWYQGGRSMRPFLFAESPVAFRRRFIFTEAEPLRRARMPKDARFWHYETMRSGLVPRPEDVEAS